MRETIKAFKVLSDETRLRVLILILQRECCVCEVMQALDISQSKASRALTALYDVGFLKLRKEGLWSLYSLDDENSEYIKKLVAAIESKLANNKIVMADRTRLKTATRTGLICLHKNNRVCSDIPEIPGKITHE
jgi:ArsR family transcriptional regulator, arsenate/arsenite/antimonite-responsive transcriptional repressor